MENMQKKMLCFVLGFSLLSLVPQVTGQAVNASVTIERSQMVSLPGSNITVTCRLIGFPDPPPLFNIVKGAFLEIIHKPITEDVSNQIYLTHLYQQLGRFHVAKSTEGTDIIFKMTITGAAVEDTGYYACFAKHPEFGDLYAVKVIEIYRPPVEIFINHNDTISVREGEVIPFECNVPAVMPIPSTSLWILEDERLIPTPYGVAIGDIRPSNGVLDRIRNRTMDAWRDVSNDFLVSTLANPRCTDNPSIKTCPLHLDYTVEVTRSGLVASSLHDGRLLTCVSVMKQFTMDMVNASVLLDVTFAPKLICDGVLVNAIRVRVNTTGFKINCRVYSNPPIPDPNVMENTRTWLEGNCQSNAKIADGAAYRIYEEGMSSNKKNRTIGLEFKQPITKSYMGKTYCIRVRNENGHGEQAITIQELRLGAARMTLSATLTYFASVLLAATTVYSRT